TSQRPGKRLFSISAIARPRRSESATLANMKPNVFGSTIPRNSASRSTWMLLASPTHVRLGSCSVQSRKLALAPVKMGTTWNNTSTSAAGVINASMKRVFSFIRRRLPSRPPQHAMARSHLLPGHSVDTSSSARKQASLVAGRRAVDFVGVFGQHLRYVLALAGERRDRHVRICFVHSRPLSEVVRRMRDRRLIEHRVLERREVLVLGCELGPELDVGRRTAGLLPHLDLPGLVAHHRGEHLLGELLALRRY